MSRPYPGYFITLEGEEGAGKTSHMPGLVEALREQGLIVYPTREPGGTSIGEQIRDLINNFKNVEMSAKTETLLYQGARAQIVEEVVRPRLQDGDIVICDRYFDSTLAYQGFGHRQDIEDVIPLIEYATGGLKPDLTVLMDVDVEIGLKRKKGSDEWNRMDAYGQDFHQRVRKGYLTLAEAEPQRWIIVDANKSKEEVFGNLKREVINKLTFEGFIEGGRKGIER